MNVPNNHQTAIVAEVTKAVKGRQAAGATWVRVTLLRSNDGRPQILNMVEFEPAAYILKSGKISKFLSNIWNDAPGATYFEVKDISYQDERGG